MELPAWAIFATLVLGFGATGLVTYSVCFAAGGRNRLAGFSGVVAPFSGGPQVLFALTAVFLANDAWIHSEQAERFMLEERDSALAVQSLSAMAPSHDTALRSGLRAYLQAMLVDDWGDQPVVSPRPAAALNHLLHVAGGADIARETGPAVQAALIAAVGRIASARSGRLALLDRPCLDLKWGGAMMLALIAQIAVAVVHLERRRAQALALVVYTASVVTILGVIATCEQPFGGSIRLEPTALYTVLHAARDG
jgi:hypothetical protein